MPSISDLMLTLWLALALGILPQLLFLTVASLRQHFRVVLLRRDLERISSLMQVVVLLTLVLHLPSLPSADNFNLTTQSPPQLGGFLLFLLYKKVNFLTFTRTNRFESAIMKRREHLPVGGLSFSPHQPTPLRHHSDSYGNLQQHDPRFKHG